MRRMYQSHSKRRMLR